MPIERIQPNLMIGRWVLLNEPVETLLYGGEVVVRRGVDRITGEIKQLRARYDGVDDMGTDLVDKYWVTYHPSKKDDKKENFIDSVRGREVNEDPDLKGKLRWRYDSTHQGYELRDLARRRLEDLLQSCLDDLVAT